MKTEDGKAELEYQLIKLILQNFLEQGLISQEDYEHFIKQAQADFNPIIGILD